jgi:hypothetical protein
MEVGTTIKVKLEDGVPPLCLPPGEWFREYWNGDGHNTKRLPKNWRVLHACLPWIGKGVAVQGALRWEPACSAISQIV